MEINRDGAQQSTATGGINTPLCCVARNVVSRNVFRHCGQ